MPKREIIGDILIQREIRRKEVPMLRVIYMHGKNKGPEVKRGQNTRDASGIVKEHFNLGFLNNIGNKPQMAIAARVKLSHN